MTDPSQPDRPYNEFSPLPPAVELETKTVLKQCITARAALAELKKAVEMIPNPTMLINHRRKWPDRTGVEQSFPGGTGALAYARFVHEQAHHH